MATEATSGLFISRNLSFGSAALTPTQALVQSFQGTGLLDALLVFDPAHYSTPGSTPGHLVDALGGDISYDAPNTQATPWVVQDASGYSYAVGDGMDNTLIASANQTVPYYCALFRSTPGQTTWNDYGSLLDTAQGHNANNANRLAIFDKGYPDYYFAQNPRAVWRNGVALTGTYDLNPITTWMLVEVSTYGYTASQVLQLFALENTYYASVHLAALGIRYTEATAAQQSQIQALLTPVQQALLATA